MPPIVFCITTKYFDTYNFSSLFVGVGDGGEMAVEGEENRRGNVFHSCSVTNFIIFRIASKTLLH